MLRAGFLRKLVSGEAVDIMFTLLHMNKKLLISTVFFFFIIVEKFLIFIIDVYIPNFFIYYISIHNT